jgi:hypothetical protein
MHNQSEIIDAWAEWVNRGGPPVQGRGLTGSWETWLSKTSLNLHQYDSWRIKPESRRARLYFSGGHVWVAIQVNSKVSTPEIVLLEGEEWLGDWQEIPD